MITLFIPTYNRLAMWQDKLLLNSLLNQTDKNYELLIVDDNSTDDTILFLSEYFKEYFSKNKKHKNNIKVRILKIIEPKDNINQVCGLSDNVGFKEASGDIIIHCDDDFLISKKLVEYVRGLCFKELKMYYGNIVYSLDTNTNAEISWDRRCRLLKGQSVVELPRQEHADWGGLWACSKEALLEVGGHDISIVYNRGVDGLLGYRLRNFGVKMFFVGVPEMRGIHRGLSWFRKMSSLSETSMIRKLSVSPYSNIRMYKDKLPATICNGGKEFWKCGWFDELYEEIEWKK